MDERRSEFLITMVEILGRLHDTTVAKGEPLLASVLAIAKGEAEDALRHANELAAIFALRQVKSVADGRWHTGARAAAPAEPMDPLAEALAEALRENLAA